MHRVLYSQTCWQSWDAGFSDSWQLDSQQESVTAGQPAGVTDSCTAARSEWQLNESVTAELPAGAIEDGIGQLQVVFHRDNGGSAVVAAGRS